MPLLTYYAYIGFHRTRLPMLTVDRLPTGWLELKQVLTEVMETVWREHKQEECYVSLDHHLKGKGFRGFSGYRSRSFHFSQQVEAFFWVRYNLKMGSVTFGQASFGPHLASVSVEYWIVEGGRRYCVPALISREHQHFGYVKALLRLSALCMADGQPVSLLCPSLVPSLIEGMLSNCWGRLFVAEGEHLFLVQKLTGRREGKFLDTENCYLFRIKNGKVVEGRNMPTDQYAFDEYCR